MSVEVDPQRLDDPGALAAADTGDMLRQVASAAAQVREAQLHTGEAGIERVTATGRPRALVVVGIGNSAIAGDMLAAVCGPGCPVPVITVRGHRLPGWVGATDLVFAVSCSGTTEETLAAAVEAVRRGSRLIGVGSPGSPLADIAEQAGAPFVPVRAPGQPRAALWALAVPLVLTAGALGLADVAPRALEQAARVLEDVSHRCRPASESFVNPGKQLALEIAGSVPVIWGGSPPTAVAARRFACQLAENAAYPAVYGDIPEAGHNQVMTFDGPFGGAAADLFRDRVEEPEETRLRLVLLRDTQEDPRVASGREAAVGLARERGVPVSELAAEGAHPLERLAGLIAYADYASVYLALAIGVDPAPVAAIEEFKVRVG